MEDKLAEDILLLDLRGVCDFTEFFVLATGSSDRMLASLAENTEVKGKAEGLGNPYIEGLPQSGWMVLDYGSVVVHLFSPKSGITINWKSSGRRENLSCALNKKGRLHKNSGACCFLNSTSGLR